MHPQEKKALKEYLATLERTVGKQHQELQELRSHVEALLSVVKPYDAPPASSPATDEKPLADRPDDLPTPATL